jgi:hypothetical protein
LPLEAVEEAARNPGRWSMTCFVAALVAAAVLGLDHYRPTSFQAVPWLPGLAWFILVAGPILGIVLALVHYLKRKPSPRRPKSEEVIEPRRLDASDLPLLEQLVALVGRRRDLPRNLDDPILQDKIALLQRRLAHLSEEAVIYLKHIQVRQVKLLRVANTDPVVRELLDKGFLDLQERGSKRTTYTVPPQTRDALNVIPHDPTVWNSDMPWSTSQAEETLLDAYSKQHYPVPQVGTVQVTEPWLREVYINGDYSVRAGFASGETITVPAGDVLIETRDVTGRIDFRKRLHVRAGSIYTEVRLEKVAPDEVTHIYPQQPDNRTLLNSDENKALASAQTRFEAARKAALSQPKPDPRPIHMALDGKFEPTEPSLASRLDALSPKGRDYLRWIKAHHVQLIEGDYQETTLVELDKAGFIHQVRQSQSVALNSSSRLTAAVRWSC